MEAFLSLRADAGDRRASVCSAMSNRPPVYGPACVCATRGDKPIFSLISRAIKMRCATIEKQAIPGRAVGQTFLSCSTVLLQGKSPAMSAELPSQSPTTSCPCYQIRKCNTTSDYFRVPLYQTLRYCFGRATKGSTRSSVTPQLGTDIPDRI